MRTRHRVKRRFNDRQNTPAKQWKITDEDWRNREKWPQYEAAIDEMLEKTSTENAPWIIIESNDKKYARLKALRILIAALEKACDELSTLAQRDREALPAEKRMSCGLSLCAGAMLLIMLI